MERIIRKYEDDDLKDVMPVFIAQTTDQSRHEAKGKDREIGCPSTRGCPEEFLSGMKRLFLFGVSQDRPDEGRMTPRQW